MFGTLVLVFPTQHEGGALVLRHNHTDSQQPEEVTKGLAKSSAQPAAREWVFDSGAELASQTTPSIGYVAFFSDVEHEVRRVVSGHRITLTYNLYFAEDIAADVGANMAASKAKSATTPPPTLTTPSSLSTRAEPIKFHIQTILANNEILPQGGVLGFGLNHVYPVEKQRSIRHIPAMLKGSDLLLWNVLRDLGLEPTVYYVYRHQAEPDFGMGNRSRNFILDHKMRFGQCEVDLEYFASYIHSGGGSILNKDESILWVTTPTGLSTIKESFVAYGNQAMLDFVYADLCLVARVGEPTSRLIYMKAAEVKEKMKKARGRR